MAKMSSPLISVLMLTYNHERFIAQAIESVLAQKTEYPFELIICDDASNDRTADIAREYSEKDSRVRLSLQTVNTRLGKNFADGCSLVRGKYVAFCEGDDYWSSLDKLQRQVSFLEANPDFAIAAHRVQILNMADKQPNGQPQYIYKDCTGEEQRIRDGVFYADEAIDNYYFQTGSLVLRWRFPGGLPQWFRKRMMYDHFLFMLHAVEGKIKYFDEPMSVWRRHAGGYSWLQTQDKGLFFQKEGNDWIALYAKMDEFFSYRFTHQIRERILLALRSIVSNCAETGNLDQIKLLVDNYGKYFNDIQKNSVLLDAIRLAYPEKQEFAPPWQSAPSVQKKNAALNIGGIFPAALDDIPEDAGSIWQAWTKNREYALFFNLRSALMKWLWENGVNTVWMPVYLPPSLEDARSRCQFTRKLYKVGRHLLPPADFVDSMAPGDAIVTINYLGRPIPPALSAALNKRKDIFWAQDLAQSFDPAMPCPHGVVLYSPRKLLGVPDGGIMVGDGVAKLAEWLEEENGEVLAERASHACWKRSRQFHLEKERS